MEINAHNFGKTAVFELEGRFVFESHKTLRTACEPAIANDTTACIQLEMSQVEYLDSAALGMLLLVKEKAGKAGKVVQIKGARGIALQVLQVARFDQIFEIAN